MFVNAGQVDDFDAFRARWIGKGGEGAPLPKPHKRALLFVDNSGADVVLGMLPLARELLRRGTEVCLLSPDLLLFAPYLPMIVVQVVTLLTPFLVIPVSCFLA